MMLFFVFLNQSLIIESIGRILRMKFKNIILRVKWGYPKIIDLILLEFLFFCVKKMRCITITFSDEQLATLFFKLLKIG